MASYRFLSYLWLHQYASQTFAIIIILAFFRLLYTSYISPLWYLKKLRIKVPLPKPFIGNVTDEGGTNQHIAQVKRQERFGTVNGTLFFHIPTIWIGDPNILKIVTVKEFSNFTNRFSFVKSRPPFDDSVLQLKDQEWKRVRNILLPTFSVSKLKAIVPLVKDTCRSIIRTIAQAEEEQKSIDIWRECGKFSMKVMLVIAFGMDFKSEEQERKLTNAAAAQFRGAGSLKRLLIFICGPLYKFLKPFVKNEFDDSLEYLTNTAKNVIKERRRNLKERIPCRNDILQQMIEAGDSDKLKNAEIVAQSVIFLTVGYETTANTLAFACYLLAINPNVQKKLLEEIDTICPAIGGISYDALFDLQYLEMVIAETLRMYPPVFFVNRDVKETMVIDGVRIGRGVMLGIPIYAIHHNPKLWPNPDQFMPERFSSKEKSKRHPYSYLPFGSGPRNCLGIRLAMLEVKIALVSILQNFELIISKDTVIPIQVRTASTLSPANELNLGFRKRY
ncbi:Cytochrome P450 3A24 [Trichoplax sp. H2]|nr:Cytochrome P450 3A24 [Trichoplax sp. H2]|eukprot:RDD37243.1 Cytochrome P450 3A24 [Trichoplax sp. H2]